MATSKKKVPAKKKTGVKKKVAVKKVVVVRNAPIISEPAVILGKKGIFHMFVSFNDQEFEGNTDDIQAAVLALSPQRINTKTIMRFSLNSAKNGKIIEKVMMVHFARRIFNNDMAAFILAKGVMLGLGYES